MTPPRHSTDKIIVSIDAELEELVPGFLANRRRDVETLQTAMRHNDIKTARMLGHRMKGDGGGYGFHGITEIGNAIEQAAMMNDPATIAEQITALSDYLARLEVVYRR